ncbi:Uncharacterised protein [uncultured archaeon]|nr:Uncharacterised protein [uncultured archaeon]
MSEDTRAKITIRIQDKIMDILVDEEEALSMLDILLGRVKPLVPIRRPIITSSVASPKTNLPQETTPKESDLGEIKLKVPERSLIEEYIKSRPEYGFSIKELIDHFVGKELSKLDEKDASNWTNALYAKINRICKAIGESEHGKWLTAGRGLRKTFKFVKEGGGEQKNEGQQQTVENY